jgi:uncharacterized membrane protein YfcA
MAERYHAEAVVQSHKIERTERRSPPAAAITGAAVGILGGLLGLGGAEFRLPVLVRHFRYSLRHAIALNLAVSLITVIAAASSRIVLARQVPDASAWPVGVTIMLGGMLGAGMTSRWLVRVSDRHLHLAVRTLLIGIGVLLILEAAAWESNGLPVGTLGRLVAAAPMGVGIGMVSTLLGVAGGELIIPTLVLMFAVPVKAAGTLSLLISIPTILVGLARHRAHGGFGDASSLRALIIPMGIGTIFGGTVGGMLVAFVAPRLVKMLLGCVLIASAVRLGHGATHAKRGTR